MFVWFVTWWKTLLGGFEIENLGGYMGSVVGYPRYTEKHLENAVEGFLLAFYYLVDDCKYFEAKRKLKEVLKVLGRVADRKSNYVKFKEAVWSEFMEDSKFNFLVCKEK